MRRERWERALRVVCKIEDRIYSQGGHCSGPVSLRAAESGDMLRHCRVFISNPSRMIRFLRHERATCSERGGDSDALTSELSDDTPNYETTRAVALPLHPVPLL